MRPSKHERWLVSGSIYCSRWFIPPFLVTTVAAMMVAV
jgi:hypothetical protein